MKTIRRTGTGGRYHLSFGRPGRSPTAMKETEAGRQTATIAIIMSRN
jgi:hypothetical protein